MAHWQKALLPVIPSVEEFPYAIRVVSEVLSSNGSTSQGSICGSTLALMDAGVPIKRPVAGISCGLISDQETGGVENLHRYSGVEDFTARWTSRLPVPPRALPPFRWI